MDQQIFDLLVYLKYYLPADEYGELISNIKAELFALKSKILPPAFDNVRAQMGIVSLDDLDQLVSLPKNEIRYNKFDTL